MMASETGLAPVVESILDAARQRETPDRTLSVDARSLQDAIGRAESNGRVPVIAEIKPTSPTTDGVHEGDPVALAEQMVAGGATALSVLTEPTHFQGSPDLLRAVRDAVSVPVLRKDFVLRESQLDTVKADMVLVIARFVENLEQLVTAAKGRGFQVLVEAHNQRELSAAQQAGADIVGINNRDLAQLTVDLGTFERVSEATDNDLTLIAESGIKTQEDVRRMRRAGADALLVGSAIMDGDVAESTRRLTHT